MVTALPKEEKGFRSAKQARARIKHPLWIPFHLKCEFWAPSKGIQSASNRQPRCLCHQRKADTNTMPLPGLARYQQELISRSLNLSYELLLLSETWASLTGLHVLYLNPKRMNRTAFSMRRCL